MGNDAAFGTGASSRNMNDGRIGALNGDHVISNNIKSRPRARRENIEPRELNNATDAGIANGGAITVLGPIPT